MPPPPAAQKPGARCPDHRRARRRALTGEFAKAVEPPRRRARVDPATRAQVLARVREDVDQRVAHHARRPQRTRVVTVAPDGAVATHRTVRGERAADRESAHAARELDGGVRLDDQVQVVGLDGEVHDAERLARCGAERGLERTIRGRRAEPADAGTRAQRDQRGMTSVVLRPCAMRNRPAARCALPTGTATRTTPARSLDERKGTLGVAHLDKAILDRTRDVKCNIRLHSTTHSGRDGANADRPTPWDSCVGRERTRRRHNARQARRVPALRTSSTTQRQPDHRTPQHPPLAANRSSTNTTSAHEPADPRPRSHKRDGNEPRQHARQKTKGTAPPPAPAPRPRHLMPTSSSLYSRVSRIRSASSNGRRLWST